MGGCMRISWFATGALRSGGLRCGLYPRGSSLSPEWGGADGPHGRRCRPSCGAIYHRTRSPFSTECSPCQEKVLCWRTVEANTGGGTGILGPATSASSSPIPCYGQFVRIDGADRPHARQQQVRSGLTSFGRRAQKCVAQGAHRVGSRMVTCGSRIGSPPVIASSPSANVSRNGRSGAIA
jgi:hypothetical protein